jgi:2-polyprenyl-3-methyl-5-hydroxy-6-metoxy-1,4-benzoquinol methylase
MTDFGTPQPRIGDAFGEMLRAAWAEEVRQAERPDPRAAALRPVIEIAERDDGLINGTAAARYFTRPEEWPPFGREVMERIHGRTLDVGAGAGRLALALQERDVPVVALDVSAGTIEVAAARGVRETVCATIEEHAAIRPDPYDCFALFGNNVGLLESRERAPQFLDALAAMAKPGAQVVAQGTNPYLTDNALHLEYYERNQRRGRMGGQVRLRVRFADLATDWFDYLLCSPEEFEQLVANTRWSVEEIDDSRSPSFVAVLRLL